MYDFDLLVIGAGSGGVRAARMAAATGARVAVVEANYLGGTCVNVGCVPKKLFYYGAHFHEDFADARGYGWEQASAPTFNWPTLRDNKDAEISRLNGIYQRLLETPGVRIIDGWASIVDAHTVAVDGSKWTAEKLLIAVGGEPSVPSFPGSDLVITSDDVFHLPSMPERVLVVGGGYIAVEFTGIFNGFGVDTQLAYRGDVLLRHFDHSLGQFVADEIVKKGVELKLGCNVESISAAEGNALQVRFTDGSCEEFGAVLYATGRKPRVDGLGLDQINVEQRPDGTIVVDEYFQSSEPSVFALGDVIGTPELTPVALAQGMAFVSTWFRDQATTVDYQNIPTAIFCQPNVATVGLSEAQARDQFDSVKVFESSFGHLKHSISGSAERTYMKLVVDAASDRVVGAHMVGAEAGEIVQGLAVAIKAGATKAVFDATIGIHPTAAEEFVTMRDPVR